MTAQAFTDSGTMLRRNLRKMRRYPSLTLFVAGMPIVLLLIFVSSIIARTPYRMVVLCCQMAVLGAFIGFVFIMDHPLKGRSAVDPAAIVQTIAIIEGRKG